MKYLIVGGKQRDEAIKSNTHNTTEEGRVLLFDDEAMSVSVVIRHKTADEYLPSSGTSISFKACSVRENRLIACTQTEVIVYNLVDFQQEFHFSHRYMNDVHHVDYVGGKYYVVSTGLDAILIFNKKGELENYINVVHDYDARERFGDIDFRQIPTTKPHRAHPNFITVANEKIWVTRFHNDSLLEMNGKRDYDQLGIKRMHDGHLEGNKGYYTCVDGSIVIVDYKNLSHEVIDLNAIENTVAPLGWCRGLYRKNESECIVGFSRLRATKNIANLEWIKNFKRNIKSIASKPTRISCYNVDIMKLAWTLNIEKYGVNLIYSILPLEETI